MNWREEMRDKLASNGVYERCTHAGIKQNEKEWKDAKLDEYEILIEKMKRCENCAYDYPGTGEDFDDICHRCKDGSEWELYNE